LTETLRKRVRQAEVDTGKRPGTTTEESAEPRRANEILKAASALYGRPTTRSCDERVRWRWSSQQRQPADWH
jgi:transposase